MTGRIFAHKSCVRMQLATVALLITGTASGAETYHPSTTGAQVVKDMLADPNVGVSYLKRERMMGYLDGVMDASVDVEWCPARKPVSHEMNYLLTEEISKLSADALKGNAVPLITAALRKMYPCTVGRTS